MLAALPGFEKTHKKLNLGEQMKEVIIHFTEMFLNVCSEVVYYGFALSRRGLGLSPSRETQFPADPCRGLWGEVRQSGMQHGRLLSCGGLRWPSIFKSSKVPSTVPEGRREQIRPPGHRTSAVCTWPVCTSGEATPASSEQPSLLDLFRTGGMSVEVIASE